MMSSTVIEIKLHRWGWKVFEAPGVEPVFHDQRQAIDYAQSRACFQSGEIRIFNSTGNLEHIIPFNEADRKL
jgi:methyl coenzyme M reductase alpha subunit